MNEENTSLTENGPNFQQEIHELDAEAHAETPEQVDALEDDKSDVESTDDSATS